MKDRNIFVEITLKVELLVAGGTSDETAIADILKRNEVDVKTNQRNSMQQKTIITDIKKL